MNYLYPYDGPGYYPPGFEFELTVDAKKVQIAGHIISCVANYCKKSKIKVAWFKPHFSEYCSEYKFYFTDKNDMLQFKLGFNEEHISYER